MTRVSKGQTKALYRAYHTLFLFLNYSIIRVPKIESRYNIMATINKKLQALTKDQIQPISEEYLRGWQNLLPKYGFTIKGFNNKRDEFGFKEHLTRDLSVDYRVKYVKDHFSKQEIEATLLNYMMNARVDGDRWNGIDLFDCHFNGKDYAKCFKKIAGPAKFKKLSEAARVSKIQETDQDRYGGTGLAGQQTLQHAQATNFERYGGANVMEGKMVREYEKFRNGDPTSILLFLKDSKFKSMRDSMEKAYLDFSKTGVRGNWLRVQSRHELFAFNALVNYFGYDDVVVQYGISPKDDRYPFNCDFYIKSEDLFIELNIHYAHSNHWYDSNNPADTELLKSYQNLGTRSAQDFVKIWGLADVRKHDAAIKNQLRYLVFWDGRSHREGSYSIPDLSDFNEWLVKYQGNYESFIKDYPSNTY